MVDYGNGKTVWYGEEDYGTWSLVEQESTPHPSPEPTTEDIGEQVLDYQEPPEEEPTIISEVTENPIEPEKKVRKKINPNPKDKPKKKK